MKFNEKLQKLRKDNNFSQEQLANEIGVSRQSVSKWESGTSYPEMDKLLTLAKMFNITLEQLTNDEISIENIKENNQNLNYAISYMKDLIDDTIKLANNMTLKKFVKFMVEIFVILFILFLLRVPFDFVSNLGRVFTNSLGNVFGSPIKNIWEFIINVIYMFGSLLLFGYIYKEYLLEKYKGNVHGKVIEVIKDGNISDNEDESEKQTYIYYKNDSVIKNLFKFIMYGLITLFTIPFIFTQLGLIVLFGLLLSGLFFKIYYFGIILIVFSFIIMNILLLEVLIKILLDDKQNIKRVLLTFVASLTILALGSGISFVELSNTTFNASINKVYKTVTKEDTIKMNKYLELRDRANITFVEDNKLKDEIKITYSYYEDFLKADLNVIGDEVIDFDITSLDSNSKITKLFVQGLKEKKLYNNFGEIYGLEIIITTSEDNISIIKENTYSYSFEIELEENQKIIDDLTDENDKLTNKVYDLNDEILELKDKLNELKDLLQ